MSNIGRQIADSYCNGFAGRRYDLYSSMIEAEGRDWIVIRTSEGESVFINFDGRNKDELQKTWTVDGL
jgi:hypothetical protein